MMIVEFPTQTVKTDDVSFPHFPQQPFFSGVMPLPPSINDAYQIITYKGGKRIGPSSDLQQFKNDAALMLTQAEANWSLINAIRDSKRKVPLAVEIRVYFRSQWKQDLDDVLKFIIDAAFTRIQLNDNQVIELHSIKEVDPIEPRATIEIKCVVGH